MKLLEIFKKKLTVTNNQELIEQIHDEFNTAGDKLLAEAKEVLSKAVDGDLDKIQKLKAAGFQQAAQVQEVEKLQKDKREAEEVAKLVQDYSFRYPNNKFITEEMVSTICKKYNLVQGNVSLYKGFVPKKNVEEIANFNLRLEDYYYSKRYKHSAYPRWESISQKDYEQGIESSYNKTTDGILMYDPSHTYDYSTHKDSFSICAPIKDMDTTNMHLNGYKLEKHVPDPVVLQPVKGGYLIVTAWGDEQSDPIVVNQKFN